MKKYLGALALALALSSCSTDVPLDNNSSGEAETALQVSNYPYSSDERQLEQAINQHRQNIGLAPLQTVDFVSAKSQEHNHYMISQNVVNHDNFETRAQAIMETMSASLVHENVAYNYITASSVLAAWLSSPDHKANIEGDFTHFGFSVTVNAATGKKYYTNIFVKA